MKEFIKFPGGNHREIEADFITLTAEQRSDLYKVVCMIGVTGTGKSATANSIIGQNYFKCSAAADSETMEVRGLVNQWFGNENMGHMLMLDTPGIGDTQNRDTQHIAKMVVRLK